MYETKSRKEDLIYFLAVVKVALPHRVERLLGFSFRRTNWDRSPSPAGECVPFSLVSGGRGNTLVGEGVGGPQFRRRDGGTLWYSRYM
jgi:hypothetical protein